MNFPAEEQNPDGEDNSDDSAIILVHPKYPENIGAAARIASNFGLAKLILVSSESPDEERMLKMATHKAAHLIRSMRICANTAEAVGPFHLVVGATARRGRHRLEDHSPREVMEQLVPLLPGRKVAFMFGPESTGLSSEDLFFCQYGSTIPTAGFASINLAQAVAIHCYEFHLAKNRFPFAASPRAEYANCHDLEGMYGHIEEMLSRISFLEDTNRSYWMRSIRQFLGRMRLKKKEASIIRGVCRKMLWYDQSRRPVDQREEPADR